MAGGSDEAVQAALRESLRETLEEDRVRRSERKAFEPVYAHWWEPGDKKTMQESDLWAIRNARDSLRKDLENNTPDDLMDAAASQLMARYGIPESARRKLVYGMLEASIAAWETIERRTLGTEPMVLQASEPPKVAPPPSTPAPPTSALPMASTQLDAFQEWLRASSGVTPGTERQGMTSMRLWIEVCGDKPLDAYRKTDGDSFRATQRKLPQTYRKSPKDKERSVAEIIADADAADAPRLTDKTAKRHFSAVSQFFAFLIETGRLPEGASNQGRGFSFNTGGSQRGKRDQWEGVELTRLFASPIWTGSHPTIRARPGSAIRDGQFWLPLLGLFHGNRLEEFAQLYREDVQKADGVWVIRIHDEGDRQVKNEQSIRSVPLHSELMRLGFLEYVAATAPTPRDRIFPGLRPGGADRKLGYYYTKDFSRYRKQIGV
jgi:hypothetical protein